MANFELIIAGWVIWHEILANCKFVLSKIFASAPTTKTTTPMSRMKIYLVFIEIPPPPFKTCEETTQWS